MAKATHVEQASTTKKTITAQAIEFADIRGKKLWYLRLDNGTHDHVINIGQKTYQTIKWLEDDEPKDKDAK